MYKLTQINKLNNEVETVIYLLNNTFIPFAPGNTDYQKYLEWLAAGNTPEPADQDE